MKSIEDHKTVLRSKVPLGFPVRWEYVGFDSFSKIDLYAIVHRTFPTVIYIYIRNIYVFNGIFLRDKSFRDKKSSLDFVI